MAGPNTDDHDRTIEEALDAIESREMKKAAMIVTRQLGKNVASAAMVFSVAMMNINKRRDVWLFWREIIDAAPGVLRHPNSYTGMVFFCYLQMRSMGATCDFRACVRACDRMFEEYGE